jgi:hypothetical protein
MSTEHRALITEIKVELLNWAGDAYEKATLRRTIIS